jgi:hypothetical protein
VSAAIIPNPHALAGTMKNENAGKRHSGMVLTGIQEAAWILAYIGLTGTFSFKMME